MSAEKQALKAQIHANECNDDGDYAGAAGYYRTAAAIWLQIGEIDQYERCLSAADDMESKCEA